MLAALLQPSTTTIQPVAAEKQEEIHDKRDLNTSENALCRTCLCTDNLQSIFSQFDHDEMSSKLKIVTGLQIKLNDRLSQKICDKCLETIAMVINFRTKCKQAEETLLRMASKQDIKYESNVVIKPIKPMFNVDVVKVEFCKDDNDFDDRDEIKPFKIPFTKQEGISRLKEEKPIVTIKKVPINDKIEDKTTLKKDKSKKNVKLKSKKISKDKNGKAKKQDRSNKISTFIKVENLPADWYGKITVKTEKRPKKVKFPITTDNKPAKDESNTFIKVENLPENFDEIPGPKIPRPYRKVPVPEGPPYKCATCGKEYSKRPQYLSHVRFHTHFHVCELCGKICRNRASLRQHQRGRHGLHKIHKCSHCDYSATTRTGLTVHERRHTDDRPFVCDHCGAAFYTRRTLAQHVGVHMPANIQCPLCPKKLRSVVSLSNHKSRKHAKRYRYCCPVCPKMFNDNNTVHKHLSGHHGVPRQDHPTIQKQLLTI